MLCIVLNDGETFSSLEGCKLIENDSEYLEPSTTGVEIELEAILKREAWIEKERQKYEEHPDYPISSWENQVSKGLTIHGYWSWVWANLNF